MSQEMQEPLIYSFGEKPVMTVDLELFGPNRAIKAIGAAVTLQPSNQCLAKFKVSIKTHFWKRQPASVYWTPKMKQLVYNHVKQPYYQELLFKQAGMDYRCLRYFWLKNLSLLDELEKTAIPFHQAISQFIYFYQIQQQLHGQHLVIASDNPGIDIGLLNTILRTKNCLPLHYRSNGSYREIEGVRSLIKGHLGVVDSRDTKFFLRFCHMYGFYLPKTNHDPLDDALRIAFLYGKYILVNRYKYASPFPHGPQHGVLNTNEFQHMQMPMGPSNPPILDSMEHTGAEHLENIERMSNARTQDMRMLNAANSGCLSVCPSVTQDAPFFSTISTISATAPMSSGPQSSTCSTSSTSSTSSTPRIQFPQYPRFLKRGENLSIRAKSENKDLSREKSENKDENILPEKFENKESCNDDKPDVTKTSEPISFDELNFPALPLNQSNPYCRLNRLRPIAS